MNAKWPLPEHPVDSEALLDELGQFMNPGSSRIYRLLGLNSIEWRAEGSIVMDTAGKEFIDFCAGYAVMMAGHRHPTIVNALKQQLDRLGLSTKTMLSQEAVHLARRLAELAPGDLERSFFCATGTEANEVALKLARAYTGRSKFIAAEQGFHGKTMGSLSATAKGSYRDVFGPLVPGVTHIPFNDIAALERTIDADTAGVILEPIQGEAGVIVPDDDYLPAVRQLCDDHGTLMILDEVQTGLGRTGKHFASQHWNVVPDIMTLAKGLGGGVYPVGAAIARSDIFRIFDDNPWVHSSTTGGNPLAAVVALAALDVLVEEDLAAQAERKGAWAMGELLRMQARFPDIIDSVQGKGLLLGIRFVNPSSGIMLLTELFERGVLVVPSLMAWTIMRFAPPLNIPDDLLQEGLSRFEQVVEDLAPTLRAM